MSYLNLDWTPGFGTVYTWFAMDKNGRIAVMINNCWGDLPQSLLKIHDAELLLDDLNEYIWEESIKYTEYPQNKEGELIVDLYSYWRNKDVYHKKISIKSGARVGKWYGYITDLYCFVENKMMSRNKIIKKLITELKRIKNYSDANLSVNKGFFIYEGVEGSKEREDYPMQIRHGIVVSEVLDFTKDRVLDNDKINTYFPKTYQS